METPYPDPSLELAVPKSRPWLKWVAWGCMGSMLLMLLLGLSCFFMAKGAMKVGGNEFGPVCSRYLAKLESQDFSGAYALMGDEGKAAFSEEQHNTIMKGITEKLGPIQSMDIQFVHTGFDQRGRWGRIVYATTFQKGSGTIRFELKKKSGEYHVVGVFFESPVLTDFINKALSQSS